MKKLKIILLGIIVIVILVVLKKFFSNDAINATLIDTEDVTGMKQISELEIIYKEDKPVEMILEVSSDSQEIFDTTYEVVYVIVNTIKQSNKEDPITLEKKDLSFKLRATIDSEGFTYPKDYSKEQMQEYLQEQGWNLNYGTPLKFKFFKLGDTPCNLIG